MTTMLGVDLAGRAVLVAGGGPVAARRTAALVAEGADVLVVAPELCEDLVDLFVERRIRWETREVEERDVDGVWLTHAATGDPEVNEAVCRWATARRVWSCNVSDAASGTARTPAMSRHANLVMGVVSEGAPDPRRIARVRDRLELTLLGATDLRHVRPTHTGRVILVGGGPGAADLMTIRGRRALSEADVVVTDRLGPTSLLADLPAEVEVVNVGKAPEHHPVPQEEINQLLVDHARRGRTVVRLKGGDPFVYGRGGEEVQACRAHGIPVEVVPGVTSALAAAAAAGIPATHRGTAARVHVCHGYDELAASVVQDVVGGSATVVILMGMALLGEHAERLLEAGADPMTPVAVIERGTLEDQRVVRAPLSSVTATVRQASVGAPSVIVIGAVAAEGFLETDGGVHDS